MVSLHAAYPYTQRSQTSPSLNSTTLTITTTNNILPTSYNDYEEDSDNDDDNNNTAKNNNNDYDSSDDNETRSTNYPHLQEYLAYINSGARLNDGTTNMQVGTVVATAPQRKGGLPWFGKVMRLVDATHIQLLWFYQIKKSNNYFYQDDVLDTVHHEAIICNGVEFAPKFGDRLIWKLLTPIPFIRAMDSDTVPFLHPPLTTIRPITKRHLVDITALVFSTTNEFESYFSVYK